MAARKPSTSTLAHDAFGSPLRNVTAALTFVLVVYALATFGFVLEGWNLSDAFYMVTLTIFSVGYGEVHPINTPMLRALDMFTIVLGCTGMIVLTGALVQAFSYFQVKRLLGLERMEQEIAHLEGHAIICGLGRIGRQLAKELATSRSPFVVIERNADKAAEARALGYLALTADASDEATLRDAGIARARVLATVLPEDALNVFITLSARSLNERVEIIARGELPATEKKLIHAGASRVVLPTHIGAERIAEMILFPRTARLVQEDARMADLKRSLTDLGLALEAAELPAGSPLIGKSVHEIERMGDGGFFIVEVEHAGGQCFPNPSADMRLESRDRVTLVLRGDRMSAGSIFAGGLGERRVGRNRF